MPLTCCSHVVPAFVVFTINPGFPTAKPVFEFANFTDKKSPPGRVYWRLHWVPPFVVLSIFPVLVQIYPVVEFIMYILLGVDAPGGILWETQLLPELVVLSITPAGFVCQPVAQPVDELVKQTDVSPVVVPEFIEDQVWAIDILNKQIIISSKIIKYFI